MHSRRIFSVLALGLVAALAGACNRPPTPEEARARELELAMSRQMQGSPAQQFASPAELGQQQLPPGYYPAQGYTQGYAPGYAQAPAPVAYVRTAQGLVPVYDQGQPAPVYAQPPVQYMPQAAPVQIYRASTAGSAAVAAAPARRSGSGAVAQAPARKRTNTVRDAAIGAAVGTIAGVAVGKDVKGALVGAAAGGLLGAVVGSTVDVQHR